MRSGGACPRYRKPPARSTSGATTDSSDSQGGPAPPPPDARFTLASERTLLAWNRTALALVVAGLAIVQLLPPFPGVPWGRHVLGVPLIALGAALSVTAYLEWRRAQDALRRGVPLPRSVLPGLLSATVTGVGLLSAAVLLASAVR